MAISNKNARIAVMVSTELKEVIEAHAKLEGVSVSRLAAAVIVDHYKQLGIDCDNDDFSTEAAKQILIKRHVEKLEQELTSYSPAG